MPSLKAGARYFYPAPSGTIWVLPMQDRGVFLFSKTYPGLYQGKLALEKFLKESPEDIQAWVEHNFLPDEPGCNAGWMIFGKPKLLSSISLSGVRFLTYYRNGRAGVGINNEELTYVFQGLTHDRRFYVSARIAVRHPSLPSSIDSPEAKSKETKEESDREEQQLKSLSDATFMPSLAKLDATIESLRTNLKPKKKH